MFIKCSSYNKLMNELYNMQNKYTFVEIKLRTLALSAF